MDNEVFYPPTIEDQAIGNIPSSGQDTNKTYDTSTYKPIENVEQSFPSTVIAHETISNALDTRSKKIKAEFTFGKYGAIKIGDYEFGVSGETIISPNGIVTKNINGEETIAIDGTSGDAVFKGTVAAGSFIAGTYFEVAEKDSRKGIFINDGTRDLIFIGFETT